MDTTDPLLLDSQNQQVLDGDNSALKKPNLRIILIVAPILLIVVAYTLGGSASIIIHALELNTFGLDAKGIITDKKFEGLGSIAKDYRLFYSFVANDNHTYAESAEIDGPDFSRLKIGDAVKVKYSDGNPDDARLDNFNPDEHNQIAAWLFVGLPSLEIGRAHV